MGPIEAGAMSMFLRKQGPARFVEISREWPAPADIVDYAVPGGWLVDRLLVQRDVKRILEFRQWNLDLVFSAPYKDGRQM
jgi:hypothetical protein